MDEDFWKNITLNAAWDDALSVVPTENPCKDIVVAPATAGPRRNMSSFVEDAKKAIGKRAKRPKGELVTILVDGDLIAYRCAAATNGVSYRVEVPMPKERLCKDFKYHKEAMKFKTDMENGGYTGIRVEKLIKPEPVEKAIANMRSIMVSSQQYLEDKLKRPVTFKTYLTSDNLFRTDISPTYKVSRENTERPVNLKSCKEYLTNHYHAETVAGYEADDLMAIAATAMSRKDCVIMSLDKDLRQIPGKHYDFVKQELYDVSGEGAMRNFWTQALVGDKTDDIPGIYGIGPVKARKILDEVPANSGHWAFYKRVVEAWMHHTPRESEKEDDRTFTTRVMAQLGTSCRLLWLSREIGDLWDAPIPTVASDTKTEPYDTVVRLAKEIELE